MSCWFNYLYTSGVNVKLTRNYSILVSASNESSCFFSGCLMVLFVFLLDQCRLFQPCFDDRHIDGRMWRKWWLSSAPLETSVMLDCSADVSWTCWSSLRSGKYNWDRLLVWLSRAGISFSRRSLEWTSILQGDRKKDCLDELLGLTVLFYLLWHA